MNNLERYPKVLCPPGGLVIWIFSLSEMFVFICCVGAFLYEKRQEPEVFETARLQLNQILATLNALVLITSSFFAVRATQNYKLKNKFKTLRSLIITFILGCVFIFLKIFEYTEKSTLGFNLDSNTFFDYYWLLTGFHAIHVVLGLVILITLFFYSYKEKKFEQEDMGFHTGINYWHLCDLIWLTIFPVIYLL